MNWDIAIENENLLHMLEDLSSDSWYPHKSWTWLITWNLSPGGKDERWKQEDFWGLFYWPTRLAENADLQVGRDRLPQGHSGRMIENDRGGYLISSSGFVKDMATIFRMHTDTWKFTEAHLKIGTEEL